MPRRNPVLANQEIYHVFNRAVGNEEILLLKRELNRAIELIDYYRFPQKLRYSKYKTLPGELQKQYRQKFKKSKPLVEIYSSVFMPNHYHLLLKQLQNNGIYLFVSNFQNSFAKYFNLRNKRNGTLFQNAFKAKRVETEEEFIHLSRYIHLNPVTSFLIKFDQLSSYPWCSFSWYMDESKNQFINTQVVISLFKSKGKYQKFVADQADYQRKLSLIKKLIPE